MLNKAIIAITSNIGRLSETTMCAISHKVTPMPYAVDPADHNQIKFSTSSPLFPQSCLEHMNYIDVMVLSSYFVVSRALVMCK